MTSDGRGYRVSFVGRRAYGIESIHGDDFDGPAATALGLAAHAFGSVHSVSGLGRVEHYEAASSQQRRSGRRRGRRRRHAGVRSGYARFFLLSLLLLLRGR